jgi:hypothetical protein
MAAGSRSVHSVEPNRFGKIIKYKRPTDWIDLPASNDAAQKITLLVAVFNLPVSPLSFRVQGNYTVDWGDGSGTENIASNTVAGHSYTYANISSGTTTRRGYRQVIVTITPQAGQNITLFSIQDGHASYKGGGTTYINPVLDMDLNTPNLTSLLIPVSYYYTSCERWRLRAASLGNIYSNNLFNGVPNYACVTLEHSITNITDTFNNCLGLVELNLPESCASLTSAYQAFFNCSALGHITLPSAPVTNFVRTVRNSHAVKSFCGRDSASAYETWECTPTNYNLRSFRLGRLKTSQNGSSYSMFSDCVNLEELPPLYSANMSEVQSLASNCFQVTETPAYSFPAATSAANLFSGCSSLESTRPLRFNVATTGQGMFYNNYSIKRANIDYAPSLTNATDMFYNDYSLERQPNLSLSAVTNITRMYAQSGLGVVSKDYPTATTLYQCFYRTYGLYKVSIDWDFAAAAVPTNMFQEAGGTREIVFTKLKSSTTNITAMFLDTQSRHISLANTSAVTNFNSSLVVGNMLTFTLPNGTGAALDVYDMFYNGASGTAVMPAYDFSKVNVAPLDYPRTTAGWVRFRAQNFKVGSHNISSSMFGTAASVEEYFDGFGLCALLSTGTIGWAVPVASTIVTKTSCGTTSGSAVVTQSNTTSLANGHEVTGTGVSDVRAVTLQNTGDTVTLNSHGIPNAKKLIFTGLGGSALLHFEGTNNSTTFTDEVGNTVTYRGLATISTTQFKWGSSSLRIPGINSYIALRANDFGVNTGNFCIEFWFRRDSTQPTTKRLAGSGAWAANHWTVGLDGSNNVTLWVYNNNTGAPMMTTSGVTINADTWYHCAVVRNGNDWDIYINGTSRAGVTWSGSFDGSGNGSRMIIIGGNGLSNEGFAGYIDEFRFQKSATYTADFTEPSAAFTSPGGLGLATYTPYYVVSTATNTFQVSDTEGGAAKVITADGDGFIYYVPKITAITTNTDFTLDVPCSATGTVSLVSGNVARSKALFKAWVV